MNWKEELNQFPPKQRKWWMDFISIEIIEKLIEDIPDNGNIVYAKPNENSGLKLIKQQLRDKWLNNNSSSSTEKI
jgi:hypothetical protein